LIIIRLHSDFNILQGQNFSLIPEATGTPPPVTGFGLLLNGCYLREYVSAVPASAFGSDATSRWRLTSLSGSNSSHVVMNGWWVAPGYDQAGTAAAGWGVQVADQEKNKGCLSESCTHWRLAAASAAVTTWGGHLDLALGTWQPIEVRDTRLLYDLLVRLPFSISSS
jgi:hypothetical protein